MNTPAPDPAARPPRVLITAGEPAGIGPDVVLDVLARHSLAVPVAVVGDPAVLSERAAALDLATRISVLADGEVPTVHSAGEVSVLPVRVPRPVRPGRPDPGNSAAVVESLRIACDACLGGGWDAVATAPVNKAVINDGGIAFTGHTEYFAERCGSPRPVMLLVAGTTRVALATTHLPLADVPGAITAEVLEEVLRVLDADLRRLYRMPRPRITVCGLNPHAGDGGHLGTEDADIIAPVIEALGAQGLELRGPMPADTAFTPPRLAETDAVLAMYHDQGLPVIKHIGFGRAVNVTLGLPVIRTSVDHGTALDLAGSGRAESGSMLEAVRLAVLLAGR